MSTPSSLPPTLRNILLDHPEASSSRHPLLAPPFSDRPTREERRAKAKQRDARDSRSPPRSPRPRKSRPSPDRAQRLAIASNGPMSPRIRRQIISPRPGQTLDSFRRVVEQERRWVRDMEQIDAENAALARSQSHAVYPPTYPRERYDKLPAETDGQSRRPSLHAGENHHTCTYTPRMTQRPPSDTRDTWPLPRRYFELPLAPPPPVPLDTRPHTAYESKPPTNEDGQVGQPRGSVERTSKACDQCRAKKTRCSNKEVNVIDGVPQTPCQSCKSKGIRCIYTGTQKKRGPTPGTTRQSRKMARPSPSQSTADLAPRVSPGVGDHQPPGSGPPNAQLPTATPSTPSPSPFAPPPSLPRNHGASPLDHIHDLPPRTAHSGRSSFASSAGSHLLTPDDRRESYGFDRSPGHHAIPEHSPYRMLHRLPGAKAFMEETRPSTGRLSVSIVDDNADAPSRRPSIVRDDILSWPDYKPAMEISPPPAHHTLADAGYRLPYPHPSTPVTTSRPTQRRTLTQSTQSTYSTPMASARSQSSFFDSDYSVGPSPAASVSRSASGSRSRPTLTPTQTTSQARILPIEGSKFGPEGLTLPPIPDHPAPPTFWKASQR